MFFLNILYTKSNWPSTISLGQFFYILMLVAFVALLAFYSTKLIASARRGPKGNAKRNLELVESIGVGSQAMTQIIRAGHKYYLIGVTKERVNLLAELADDQINITATGTFNWDNSFDKIVRRFMSSRKEKLDTDDEQNEAHDE